MSHRSIMHEGERCYICGAYGQLEAHHCMHGTANRKKAEEDGLIVNLCHTCHMDLHDKGLEDKWLMQQAQTAWMRYYSKTVQEFRARYGKNHLH